MATSTSTTTSVEQDLPSFPLAAQIPLSSFTLPNFPPAASQLRALTLTSDISLSDYQTTHLTPGTFAPEPFSTLPKSITHLTLELFSLGFPAAFLTQLGQALPKLQSLTLFSCLIDGLSDASRHDALKFFEGAKPTLRELHVVDSFARVGFWKEIGESYSAFASTPPSSAISSTANSNSNSDSIPISPPGLKVLEVSYTYRGHYESDFLNRISGEEWPTFLTSSILGLSLNFTIPSPDEAADLAMRAEKPEDQDLLKAQDGILPFASDGRATYALKRAFERASGKKAVRGMAMRVANLSMFALRAEEVGEIVYAVARTDGEEEKRELAGLTVSILLEEGWFKKLIAGLAYKGAGNRIQSLEIVGVPVEGGADLVGEDAEKVLMKSRDGIEELNKICAGLNMLEMNVLRSRRIGSVVWEKKGTEWNMVINKG